MTKVSFYNRLATFKKAQNATLKLQKNKTFVAVIHVSSIQPVQQNRKKKKQIFNALSYLAKR